MKVLGFPSNVTVGLFMCVYVIATGSIFGYFFLSLFFRFPLAFDFVPSDCFTCCRYLNLMYWSQHHHQTHLTKLTNMYCCNFQICILVFFSLIPKISYSIMLLFQHWRVMYWFPYWSMRCNSFSIKINLLCKTKHRNRFSYFPRQ